MIIISRYWLNITRLIVLLIFFVLSRFDRGFIKDMKKNKDTEWNERRLRIIRDALFVVIPLILIVFIFLTYIKDIKTIINEVDTLRYEMDSVLTSIKSNDSEMMEEAVDHIDESSKHMQYILSEKKWKLLSHIPYIKKYIRSADTLVDVIVNASDDVLKPGVEVMKQYPLSQLKSGDGFRVDTINAYLDYLEKIEPEIEDMTSSISHVNVTFSKSENISKYVDKLTVLLLCTRRMVNIYSFSGNFSVMEATRCILLQHRILRKSGHQVDSRVQLEL